MTESTFTDGEPVVLKATRAKNTNSAFSPFSLLKDMNETLKPIYECNEIALKPSQCCILLRKKFTRITYVIFLM